MGLHGKIMNLQVEKRKQNVAIDEALKSHKNLRDIMVAIYTRAHRDARHAAAEIAAEQSFAPDEGYCRCPHCERVHDNRVACPEYLAKSQSH